MQFYRDRFIKKPFICGLLKKNKMKKLLIGLMFLGFVLACNAQENPVEGNWLLTKAKVGDEIQEPFVIADFSGSGKLIIFEMEMGSWSYNASKQIIEITSASENEFNGRFNVLALNDTELLMQKGEVELNYQRLNLNMTGQVNQMSGLDGTWEIVGPNASNTILTLDLPLDFSLVESEDGMTTTNRGTWIYNFEEETIIFVGLRNVLSGKNRIVSQEDDQLTLDNNGTSIIAKRVNTEENIIERLEFTEADFYDETGDYKYYNDEQKLPWQDPYAKLVTMQNVQQLVYNYSELIDNTQAFKSKMLTADVVASEQEESLSIDYIFYGYDRYNLPDDTKLPPNNDYYNPLFPLKDLSYRISGREQITTSAGTFNCTVLEATGSFDEVQKLWMIDDKPGVYAKIIADKPGDFGHYVIYELEEIR
jgi:hypothetical protein